MDIDDIDMGDVLETVGPPIATIVLVGLATSFAARLVRGMVSKAPGNFTRQLVYIVPKFVWGLGLLVMAGTLGINVSSFLALFATVGLGAALVFTPVGQGLFAGFLAGMDDVVHEGDVIEVLGRPGKIVRKGALSVGVEYPDGSMVYLPNTKVVDDELVNHNRIDGARINVEVKLNLDPDRALAVSIMESTLEGLEWRRQDKPTAVHFTELGSNAFHYQCYAWIDHRLDEPGYKSQMLTALVDNLNNAGISCGETGDLSMSSWPSAWDTPEIDISDTKKAPADLDHSNR